MICWEVVRIEKRIWIRSGIIEELDAKQMRLLNLVIEKIKYYYDKLYGTKPSLNYPLNLNRLKKLCHRNGQAVSMALKYLAHTIPLGSSSDPPIYYDRIKATKNNSHRPYRIYLRNHQDSLHT